MKILNCLSNYLVHRSNTIIPNISKGTTKIKYARKAQSTINIIVPEPSFKIAIPL